MLLEMDDPCWLQGILEVQQKEPLLNNELNEKKKITLQGALKIYMMVSKQRYRFL